MIDNQSLLNQIDKLIDMANAVRRTHKVSGILLSSQNTATLSRSLFAQWQNSALAFLENIFGVEHSFSSAFKEQVNRAHFYDVATGEGILKAAKEEILVGNIQRQIRTSSFENVLFLCTRFHLVATQLRTRYAQRPPTTIDDEYDAQDLLHALLRLFFEDIRPEEWTPSYAGKSARMDFLLKDEHIVVEVKRTRDGLGAKELGTQLIEDIVRYQVHPNCKTLICFVYDPEGRIVNPRGIENDLSRQDGNLQVQVIIAPKGY